MTHVKEMCKSPEHKENVTPELTLLILAGTGKTKLRHNLSGELVWVAEPDLLLCPQTWSSTSKSGPRLKRKAKRNRIQMDECLKGFTDCMYEFTKRQIPAVVKINRATVIMGILISHELLGDAVAYIEGDGQLAWRASYKFIMEYQIEDDEEERGFLRLH